MANLKSINIAEGKSADTIQFMVGTDEYAVPVGDLIDVEAEIEKQEAQLKHLEGFLAGVMKKLSNEKFVAHAPEAVVALERKKQHDSEEKIAMLKESLAKLKTSNINKTRNAQEYFWFYFNGIGFNCHKRNKAVNHFTIK